MKLLGSRACVCHCFGTPKDVIGRDVLTLRSTRACTLATAPGSPRPHAARSRRSRMAILLFSSVAIFSARAHRHRPGPRRASITPGPPCCARASWRS